MKLLKKHYKKILLGILGIYVISIFVSQQETLNSYRAEVKSYDEKITEAKEEQASLQDMKNNVDSDEYIEEIAREKLGMYLPNERVYIDAGK